VPAGKVIFGVVLRSEGKVRVPGKERKGLSGDPQSTERRSPKKKEGTYWREDQTISKKDNGSNL